MLQVFYLPPTKTHELLKEEEEKSWKYAKQILVHMVVYNVLPIQAWIVSEVVTLKFGHPRVENCVTGDLQENPFMFPYPNQNGTGKENRDKNEM